MGRPSRLGDEDRSDYADVLDEVLASAEIRRLLERSGVSGGLLRFSSASITLSSCSAITPSR
ncbi:hypothetical protein I3W98_26905, partial [Streptomyces cavourensis]|nr:hypothetical protein [Streptomyces cavourensis]